MKTISFHVHHGQVYQTIEATGETVAAALASLLAHPLGRGYAIEPDRRDYPELVRQLETTGTAKWGWGDYQVKP